MGYVIQLVKLACVGSLLGIALTGVVRPPYAVFVGLLVFYLLLVAFSGSRPRSGPPGG